MSSVWPDLPYDAWSATCDTLHAHTQVLGKLAANLAVPEPNLQHAALRLTQRGWETLLLPAPDGSGSFAVVLDLHTHHAVIEHSDGRIHRVPLTPNRPVRQITRDVLDAARQLVGPFAFDPTPQETSWTTPLDEGRRARYLRRRSSQSVLRGGHASESRALRAARAVSRQIDSSECVVGIVRSRRVALLRCIGRTAIARLHCPQLGERPTDRNRLVARRQQVSAACVFRVRLPRSRRCRVGGRSSRVIALGRRSRRVHPRLG